MSKKVLIIEDERDIAELIALHVRDQGWAPTIIRDGEAGLDAAHEQSPDLIVLDIMLPRLDGVEVCKRLRADGILTPIVMLTAKSDELDRILGLELGADDYVTKPFSVRELVARMKAVFRRKEMEQAIHEGETATEALVLGPLHLDIGKRKASVGERPLELTSREFDLLQLLISTPGRCYRREELLSRVWGSQFEGYEHTVNSHINRLRAKIEDDPSNPRYIRTVWGVGYRCAEENELEEKA